jgi:hypothetical protein
MQQFLIFLQSSGTQIYRIQRPVKSEDKQCITFYCLNNLKCLIITIIFTT